MVEVLNNVQLTNDLYNKVGKFEKRAIEVKQAQCKDGVIAKATIESPIAQASGSELYRDLINAPFLSEISPRYNGTAWEYVHYIDKGDALVAPTAGQCCWSFTSSNLCEIKQVVKLFCLKVCLNGIDAQVNKYLEQNLDSSTLTLWECEVEKAKKAFTDLAINTVIRGNALANTTYANAFSSFEGAFNLANQIKVVSAGGNIQALKMIIANVFNSMESANIAIPTSGKFYTRASVYNLLAYMANDPMSMFKMVNGRLVYSYNGINYPIVIENSLNLNTAGNGSSTMYFVPENGIGYKKIVSGDYALVDYQSLDANGCPVECTMMLSGGAVVVNKALQTFAITDVPVFAGATSFSGLTNGVNRLNGSGKIYEN